MISEGDNSYLHRTTINKKAVELLSRFLSGLGAAENDGGDTTAGAVLVVGEHDTLDGASGLVEVLLCASGLVWRYETSDDVNAIRAEQLMSAIIRNPRFDPVHSSSKQHVSRTAVSTFHQVVLPNQDWIRGAGIASGISMSQPNTLCRASERPTELEKIERSKIC